MEKTTATSGTRLRLGAVSYLNTKPLVFGLAARRPDRDRVRCAEPVGGRLARGTAGCGVDSLDRIPAPSGLLAGFRRLYRLPRAGVERQTVQPQAVAEDSQLGVGRGLAHQRSAGSHPVVGAVSLAAAVSRR